MAEGGAPAAVLQRSRANRAGAMDDAAAPDRVSTRRALAESGKAELRSGSLDAANPRRRGRREPRPNSPAVVGRRAIAQAASSPSGVSPLSSSANTTAQLESHPERKESARFLPSRGRTRFEQAMADDDALLALLGMLAARPAGAHAPIQFPPGVAPEPVAAPDGMNSATALQTVDVVVIKRTVDEVAS